MFAVAISLWWHVGTLHTLPPMKTVTRTQRCRYSNTSVHCIALHRVALHCMQNMHCMLQCVTCIKRLPSIRIGKPCFSQPYPHRRSDSVPYVTHLSSPSSGTSSAEKQFGLRAKTYRSFCSVVASLSPLRPLTAALALPDTLPPLGIVTWLLGNS